MWNSFPTFLSIGFVDHSKNHFLQMFSKAFVLSEKNVFKGKESSYFYQQPSTSNAWRKQRIFLCENMRRTKTS